MLLLVGHSCGFVDRSLVLLIAVPAGRSLRSLAALLIVTFQHVVAGGRLVGVESFWGREEGDRT